MTKTHVPAAHNQFSSSTEEITVQCLLSSDVAVLCTSGRHSMLAMVQKLNNNALPQNATQNLTDSWACLIGPPVIAVLICSN